MKTIPGLLYFSTTRGHLCTPTDESKYKDLVTGDEFTEDDDTMRPALPDDLLNTPILIESTKDNAWHYIRVSYTEVAMKKKINHLIEVDIDKDGKLIGVRLAYPFKTA
jgi:hypothetical protein